eukprot:m.123546 g.123546  ORF g.123546 m.123546 type:complete len:1114 (-) comp13466_c0_seq1:1145-4486(-)
MGVDGSPAPGSPGNADDAVYETITVHIPTTRRQHEKMMKKVVVYFQMEFSFHGQFWTTEMRYSQLYKIHKDFEGMLPMTQRPVFPPKRVANTNPVFIENRRLMLQSWLQAVLDHPKAISNPELLELLAVPATAMVWLRKYAKLMEQQRETPSITTQSSAMLMMDLEYAELSSTGRVVDDLTLSVPVTLSAAQMLQLCIVSPLAGMHTNATIGNEAVRTVLSIDELTASVAVQTELMPHWVESEPLISPISLPRFDLEKLTSQGDAAVSPTKRLAMQGRGRQVPVDMYTARASRRVDGSTVPISAVLGRTDPTSEYAAIIELPSDDPLSLAGLIVGDQIAAVNGMSMRFVGTDRVTKALEDSGDQCDVRFLRTHEVKVIDVERATRAGSSGQRLPLGATLVSEEDIYTGDWFHRFRRVAPTGAGARAGLQDGDLLLEVGPVAASTLTTDDMRAQLKNMETIVIARVRPPQAVSVVKIMSNPTARVSEGFMCPVCMKNLGTVENLVEHFSVWHPDMGPLPGAITADNRPSVSDSGGSASSLLAPDRGKEGGRSQPSGQSPSTSPRLSRRSKEVSNPELLTRERSDSVGRKSFLIPISDGPRQFVSTSVKRTSRNDGFGFSLGSSSSTGELFVTKVANGNSRGSAKLQVADVITHVDGNDVRGMDHDDAVDLILRGNTVVLGIQRLEGGPRKSHKTAMGATESVSIVKRRDDIGLRAAGLPKTTADLLFMSVSISRSKLDESFGFGLATTVSGLKVVCNVTPHGIASRALRVGDVVDTANGIKLGSFAHDSAIDLIGNTLELSLGIRRAASKLRRRRTDQSQGSERTRLNDTAPPLGFRDKTTNPARPRATTAPTRMDLSPDRRRSRPRGKSNSSQALPAEGYSTAPKTDGPLAHMVPSTLPRSPGPDQQGTPIRLSADSTVAEWENVRFCRYCGASLRDMDIVEKVAHLSQHPEFQRSRPHAPAAVAQPRTTPASSAPPNRLVGTSVPLMPSSSDPDAWWAGGYAKEYVAEVVARSRPGDFLLRDGAEVGTVLLVINDFGRAKQSVISIDVDGKCRISGIPEAFPSLYNLIGLMRMRRQYSKVEAGASFVLGMPAGNIFSPFNFKVWCLGQAWPK